MIATVERLLRVSLTVHDLERMSRFYCDAFGFEPVGRRELDPARMKLLGAPGARARSQLLALGAQQIELLEFDPPGRAYPAAATARDPWFQHIAFVVSDMRAAWEHLQSLAVTPVSTGGPQRLPPASGAVTAVKFRDPESHPLELLEFPPGRGDPRWQRPDPPLFLGFDHSAIVVADASRSRAFYHSQLGFKEQSVSLNRGPEQQRLDGLPDAEVQVIGLACPAQPTPHLELLAYRAPAPPAPAAAPGPRDVAATRVVLEVAQWAAHAALPLEEGARGLALLDPDGHRLLLIER